MASAVNLGRKSASSRLKDGGPTDPLRLLTTAGHPRKITLLAAKFALVAACPAPEHPPGRAEPTTSAREPLMAAYKSGWASRRTRRPPPSTPYYPRRQVCSSPRHPVNPRR